VPHVIYFFHLRDGSDLLLDPDGRELDSRSDVERHALVEARALISAEALTGTIRLDQRIEVEDAAGHLVHRLDFGDAVRISPP
jgi:hypothetical protein